MSSQSRPGPIGDSVGKDITGKQVRAREEALETRSFLAAVIVASIVITVAFGWVYFHYDTDANMLAAIGQLLGAFFSCLALLGIVAAQLFQYRSLFLQKAALDAQLENLIAQYDANRASMTSLAVEMLHSAIERAEQAFSRYARSLLRMSPGIPSADVLDLDKKAMGEAGPSVYCEFIAENLAVQRSILSDIENGLSASIADRYVKLFESLARRSTILGGTTEVDYFELNFDDTPSHHLFKILKDTTRPLG